MVYWRCIQEKQERSTSVFHPLVPVKPKLRVGPLNSRDPKKEKEKRIKVFKGFRVTPHLQAYLIQ